MRTSTAVLATAATAALVTAMLPAQSAVASGPPPVTVPGYSFSLTGTASLPGWYGYRGTPVGGLTGIDYDPASGTYALVSGDRSDLRPARFYSASLTMPAAADCPTVSLTGLSTLLRQDGTPYPPSSTAGADLAAPQGIRFDAASGNVLWVSAGGRTDTTAVAPSVREATRAGAFVRQLPPGANEETAEGAGPRPGGGLSGLSVSGDRVLTTMRSPMLQDGDQAVRLSLRSRSTGAPLVQFAYHLEALPGNGVADILAVNASKFLVLERSRTGRTNSNRLYEVSFAGGATNVLRFPSLTDVTYRPVTKRLVLDLAQLGIDSRDGYEGITWGPAAADGSRSLVLVSDNEFSSRRASRFPVLAVTLS